MLKGIASLSIEIAKMILPTSQIAAASIATMSAWTLGLGVAAIIGGLIAGRSINKFSYKIKYFSKTSIWWWN
jgi:Na+/glutamate symporter